MVDARIRNIAARAFRIPTDGPERDGTLERNATTLVVAEIEAGGTVGLGYGYADATVADIVRTVLAEVLGGKMPSRSRDAVRNGADRSQRCSGGCGCAISTVDVGLWDLKARLLDLPLATLLGQQRDEVAIYGSGGFTTCSPERVGEQLAKWVEQDGCRWVEMKVGAAGRR
jgi:L-alanine-DL-glutamate epimerase-like enolase superfamily enzyme